MSRQENLQRNSARYADELRQQGLKRIAVWVPISDVDRLKRVAAGMRAEAKLPLPTDGQPLTPRLVVPHLEPEQHHPHPETVWLELGQDELGLHMLLRANGGVWDGRRCLWEVPAYLPAKLGLTERVRP